MRRTVAALALPFITALMLVQPVSATDAIIYEDPEGDTPVWCLGKDATPFTTIAEHSNPPLAREGYFDMARYSLSLEEEGDHYRFWMEVYDNLPVPDPEDGCEFPDGLEGGQWVMYIDPSPYNAVYNPVTPLFVIVLSCYEGDQQYSASLFDYGTGKWTELVQGSYGYSGSQLWMEFPASIIEGYETYNLWWACGTKAVLGTSLDNTDYDCRGVDFNEYYDTGDPETSYWDIAWPDV